MNPVASINPIDATFILSVLVLGAAVILTKWAITAEDKRSQQLFAVAGVLVGLLAAGGLGTLFAQQAVESTENNATSAANQAAAEVSGEVSEQVEEALESEPSGSSGK